MLKGEIYRLDSLLSEEEVSTITNLIDNLPDSELDEDPRYGRLKFHGLAIPQHIQDKLTNLVLELDTEATLEMVYPSFGVEYSIKHGNNPNLPTHFDGDFNEAIIAYQLESSPNTVWPLGINLETYALQDNDAILFNPNANVHWRPIRAFTPDEYVRMIFFRFFNPVDRSDYSYLPNHPDDEAFKEANQLRDSLTEDDWK